MPRSLAVALALLLSACSIAPPEDSPRVAYREAESVRSLAVPPDLTRPEASEGLEISDPSGKLGSVLPEYENIRMVRAGPLQWLEVDDASPQELWPLMSGFLRSEGLTIRTQRPSEGLIETVWAKRFDAVPRGGLSGFLQNLLGEVASDEVRDKYQIRLERLNGGGSRVFLAHWMAQEVNTSPNTPNLSGELAMIRTQPDPAIAAEMRRRLLVYLGVRREHAQVIASGETAVYRYAVPVRMVETEDGAVYAELAGTDYRRALALVAEALSLAGAEVTETDESKGNIWVRWLPPEEIRDTGLFRRNEPRRLVVKLEPRERTVRIVAGDSEGMIRSGKFQVALLERVVSAMGGTVSDYRRGSDTYAPDPIRRVDPVR